MCRSAHVFICRGWGLDRAARLLRQVPLDVLSRYHKRLVACASALPYAWALGWVQRRDEEERKLWADHHRGSSLSLGKIIKDLYERRELMWDTSQAQPPALLDRDRPLRAPRADAAATRQQAAKQWDGAPKTADALKDGKKICRLWNQGRCSEPCPKAYLHVCNAIVGKGNRVCGMRNHTSRDCRKVLQTGAAGKAGHVR